MCRLFLLDKMHDANPHVVDTLRRKILDCSTPIAAKWRALFALRNITGSSAETAMLEGKVLQQYATKEQAYAVRAMMHIPHHLSGWRRYF